MADSAPRLRKASFDDLSDEQLVHKALQTERDLVAARFKHSMNQLENTAKLGVLKRDIARLNTEARQRELKGGLSKGALFAQHGKSFDASRRPSEAAVEKGGFLSGIVDKLTGKE